MFTCYHVSTFRVCCFTGAYYRNIAFARDPLIFNDRFVDVSVFVFTYVTLKTPNVLRSLQI